MRWSGPRKRIDWIVACCFVMVCLILAGCVPGDGKVNEYPGKNGKGCTKVGVLMPDEVSNPDSPSRWSSKDQPLLGEAVTRAMPNIRINYYNADGDHTQQLEQARTALANGDCMLIVAAHNSIAAATIVTEARAKNVPVIAYDRLIQSKNLQYYVSFNNIEVGRFQGQYIADHYQEYQKDGNTNIAIINGAQADTNSLLFSMGLHQVLDPLFADGKLTSVGEVFIPNWDASTAQAQVEAMLNDLHHNIQVIYVANDMMANAVISALRTAKLESKVLVTGQDASRDGIRAILVGEQQMTVYKPIARLAESTANLVKALYLGKDTNQLMTGTTPIMGGDVVPSILEKPIAVDINNVASTVIADNFISKDAVCKDVPAGTAGIC